MRHDADYDYHEDAATLRAAYADLSALIEEYCLASPRRDQALATLRTAEAETLVALQPVSIEGAE